MDKRAFKDQIYHEISQLSKGFSNPNRLEIIDLLANGEKTVEQIAREVNISFANASQHLQVLKNQRLVKTRRLKNFIYYSLINEDFFKVWQLLRNYVLNYNHEVVQIIKDFREDIG